MTDRGARSFNKRVRAGVVVLFAGAMLYACTWIDVHVEPLRLILGFVASLTMALALRMIAYGWRDGELDT